MNSDKKNLLKFLIPRGAGEMSLVSDGTLANFED